MRIADYLNYVARLHNSNIYEMNSRKVFYDAIRTMPLLQQQPKSQNKPPRQS